MNKHLTQIINSYIRKSIGELIEEFNGTDVNGHNCDMDLILLYSELCRTNKLFEYKNDFEKIVCDILDYMRNALYKGQISKLKIQGAGMFTGIGKMTFCLEQLSTATGGLYNYVTYFQRVLIKWIYTMIENLDVHNVFLFDYDCIYGAAGLLNYLLDQPLSYQNEDLIDRLTTYLIEISEYRDDGLPWCHIRGENQLLRNEREVQVYGHLNFGLAHGMIGPCIALAKFQQKNRTSRISKEAKKAVIRIESFYRKYYNRRNDVLIFPTQLPLGEYNKYIVIPENWSPNSGWCYGNAGILRGLMKVNKYIKNERAYEYYKNELIKLIDQSYELYNLPLPIICHGCASIIAIQMSAYYESNDSALLDNIERNVKKTILRQLEYESYYGKDYSFLDGKTGVLLSLLYCINKDLNFPRLLMID